MPKVVQVPADQSAAFSTGLAQIRSENAVPTSFPPDVLAAADAAAKKPFRDEHVDRTDVPFVTLDPATSTDLDQAFAIERGSGDDLVLRYAIADVPWFVRPGDPLDAEAWKRGETIYLPDGRAGLYPPALSEAAGSLLPDGPRPAVIFVVRVNAEGNAVLDGVERAIIRNRAKLAYETATDRLHIAFQPLVDLTSNRVRGFEALARWDHAKLGTIAPVEFIAVAEDSGLIAALDCRMLDSALSG